MTFAVVFDFFGTLTDPAAESLRVPAFDATAAALGVAPPEFSAAMRASFPARIIGEYGDTRSTLARFSAVTGARLDEAVAVHRAGAAAVRRPRPGALPVLDELRARGIRIGLISDCSSELYEAWPTTPFAARVDAPVFSWREGHRKPDPRLYATVAARLGVEPSACYYVGDGGSREHRGARDAGMRPVLIRNPGPDHRDDPDDYVPPLVIDDLDELLTFADLA